MDAMKLAQLEWDNRLPPEQQEPEMAGEFEFEVRDEDRTTLVKCCDGFVDHEAKKIFGASFHFFSKEELDEDGNICARHEEWVRIEPNDWEIGEAELGAYAAWEECGL